MRSTNKKVIVNIQNYIIENTTLDESGYDVTVSGTDFKNHAKVIYNIFMDEVGKWQVKRTVPEFEAFKNWCQGLPSALDTCYYYNRSAVKDLSAILEQSEAEAARYTEEKAEQMLTWLLYREIKKAV